MSAETQTMMTDQTATTTEGDTASQQTVLDDATGASDNSQQQQQAQGSENPEHQVSNTEETSNEDNQEIEGAPEAYDFKAPEGQEFDGQTIEQFSEVAKELNLPQEAAQKLLDKMSPVLAQRQAEQIQEVQQQWRQQAETDAEIGGDKLPENLSFAKKAMENFATPELKTLLNESGMGNHPEVVRMFVRVGKAISEDGFITGGSARSSSADPRRLYPNSKMN